jgi:hypothetical protein
MQQQELVSAIEAYQQFDTRQPGWLKVELTLPAGPGAGRLSLRFDWPVPPTPMIETSRTFDRKMHEESSTRCAGSAASAQRRAVD